MMSESQACPELVVEDVVAFGLDIEPLSIFARKSRLLETTDFVLVLTILLFLLEDRAFVLSS